jgi:general secretion pathway protein C
MQRVWAWIETVLRRYPWAITLLALIPCAYFDAAGVNHLLASNLFKADVSSLSRPAAPSPADLEALSRPAASHHVRDVDRILARNVFDSAAGCLNCAPPEPPPSEAEANAAPEEDVNRPPEPCEGSAKVTGAVQVDDPLWSFVFIAPAQGQAALPYRMGQTVDGKTVSSIGWHPQYGAYVVLRPSPTGARCFYAQVMPPRTAPPAPVAQARPAEPAGPVAGASGELAAALDSGIQRTGANEFSIQRSLVDRVLENQAELMRTTRIMPHDEGGRVTGVQLFGVRGNSLLGRLGMQNGDVLNRINGLEIASPDRALEAYSRLRTADRITVSVTRNGQPVNIDFNIR